MRTWKKEGDDSERKRVQQINDEEINQAKLARKAIDDLRDVLRQTKISIDAVRAKLSNFNGDGGGAENGGDKNSDDGSSVN